MWLDRSKIEEISNQFEYKHRICFYNKKDLFFNLNYFLDFSGTKFNEENIDTIIELIKNNKHREFYINDSTEPIFPYIKNISKFAKLCNLYNKSVTIITGQNSEDIFDLYKSFGLNIIFLPLYNFLSILEGNHINSVPFFKENTLEKKYLTLNKNYKLIRNLLYEFLKNNELFEFGEYSFLFSDKKSFNENIIDKNDNPFFGKSIIEKYDFQKKCFLNFVIESTNDDYFIFDNKKIKYNFVSEKTAKCILTGLPFIIVGEPNLLSALKSYDIKTFSQFWDETYDLEHNVIDRANKSFKILKNICYEKESVLREIYNETEHIHKHNVSLIYSILKDNVNTLKYKIDL